MTMELTELQKQVLQRILRDWCAEDFMVDTVTIQHEFGVEGITAMDALLKQMDK